MSAQDPFRPGTPGGAVDEQRPAFQCGSLIIDEPYPTVKTKKERTVKKTESICDGQYVTDQGSKNLHISVNGVCGFRQLPSLKLLRNAGDPFECVTVQWSGKVYVSQVTIESTSKFIQTSQDIDAQVQVPMYKFTLDLVSTGMDEGSDDNFGIVDNPQNIAPGGNAGDGGAGTAPFDNL